MKILEKEFILRMFLLAASSYILQNCQLALAILKTELRFSILDKRLLLFRAKFIAADFAILLIFYLRYREINSPG